MNPKNNNKDSVLLRRIKQAGSTIFLFFAVLSLPQTVCPYYRLGCHINFLISILFHGSQEPIQPKRPHLTRLLSSQYEFSCSKAQTHKWTQWILLGIDKAAVCFICLYTGLNNNSSFHPAAVAMICLLAGFTSKLNEVLVMIALYLTISQLDSLSMEIQLIFWFAAIVGPVVFVTMDYIGAWCTPYRYFWHFCCGILVAVGGLLNSMGSGSSSNDKV